MNTCKGRSTMNEFIQQYSKWPYVKRVIMVLVLNHFWSHILQSSTEGISLLHVVRLDAPPKVADFDDITVFDQDVLGFDVSVDEPLLVHIVNATADLDEKVKRSIFTEELFLPYQIKQVSFACILQSQVNGVLVFKTGIQSTDILVVQLFLNSDFSYKSLFNFVTW